MGPLSGFVAGSFSWSSRPPAFARQVARSHRDFLGARQLVRQDGWQAAIFGGHKRTSLLTVAHQLASAYKKRRPVQDFIASPGSTRWPCRKSAADTGFLPGSWRSSRRTAAAPAATMRRSAWASTTVPGGPWLGLSTGRVWWMIRRRGPFEDGSREIQVVEQSGHGCMARTRL